MKTVCVLGLGYIGLPTGAVLASAGFKVLGVDTKESVVTTINSGGIHIEEPGLRTLVQAAISSGNLRASLVPEASDVYILAVPTPVKADHTADMTYVTKATESLVPLLKKGDLIILESTSPPGTCRNLLVPIIEKTGLKAGQDVHLAHCPERVLPGRILIELIKNDRVIGGYRPKCAEIAKAIYKEFVEGEIFLTDATAAEMVKVTENSFRDVNIAFANEVAILCEKLGIDAAEVTKLASRHPRVNVLSPGPGVGGHCISVDPWFLIEQFPEDTHIIHAARTRNDSMPNHVVKKTLALLQGIQAPKVAALGLAYKANVDDMRESPSLSVIRGLLDAGVQVMVHDPLIEGAPFDMAEMTACCEGADCILLLTDHSVYTELDPATIGPLVRTRILFDTRNVLDHGAWEAAGKFKVVVLGNGSQISM